MLIDAPWMVEAAAPIPELPPSVDSTGYAGGLGPSLRLAERSASAAGRLEGHLRPRAPSRACPLDGVPPHRHRLLPACIRTNQGSRANLAAARDLVHP